MIKSNHLPFIGLGIIVFLSRIPFLGAGYGIEEDSWGIALAVHNTVTTGIYEASRLPGHPVQEFIYSWCWDCGAYVFNLLSALASVIATLFFALSFKHLSFRHYLWAAYAFAFTPVIFISSTYTIDFMWTEALVMVSFYCLLKKRFTLAGIALGLATGCRITSLLFILPFIILIFDKENLRQSIRHSIWMTTIALVTALCCFIPLIKTDGTAFLTFYDQFPYPPLTKVFYKATIGVWGLAGCLILLAGFITILRLKKKQEPLYDSVITKQQLWSWSIVILLFSLSYFRLPQKSGYLIPIIPFLFMLLGYFMNKKSFIVLCTGLIVSLFIFSIDITNDKRGAEHSALALKLTVSGQELFFDPVTGPVFSNYSKRNRKMFFTAQVAEKEKEFIRPTLIIAGWWYNQLMVERLKRTANPMVTYVGYTDAESLESYTRQNYSIYYLPEQEIYNDLMYKMDITKKVASPLF